MEVDVAKHIGAIGRVVSQQEYQGKPAKVVVATRTYDTDIDDLWNALTDKDRIPRWFSPVTGDFKLGGRYQVQGNAGGEIVKCDAPKELALTWEMGPGMSWLSLTLSALSPEETKLHLEHIAHTQPEWDKQYGPGAVGVGWDLSLLGLALYLDGGTNMPPEAREAWTTSDNYKQFARASSAGWRDASIASGTDKAEANKAGANTTAFYLGEQPPADV